MALVIIGAVLAYLGAGLVFSRITYRAARRGSRYSEDEIMPVLMVPFWPVMGICVGMWWVVTHDDPKQVSR